MANNIQRETRCRAPRDITGLFSPFLGWLTALTFPFSVRRPELDLALSFSDSEPLSFSLLKETRI